MECFILPFYMFQPTICELVSEGNAHHGVLWTGKEMWMQLLLIH